MSRQSDEEMEIGGAHDARVHTYEPDRVWLTLVERPEHGHGLAWSGEMAPSEARALAALLLKHADRAEGADARRNIRAVGDGG